MFERKRHLIHTLWWKITVVATAAVSSNNVNQIPGVNHNTTVYHLQQEVRLYLSTKNLANISHIFIEIWFAWYSRFIAKKHDMSFNLLYDALLIVASLRYIVDLYLLHFWMLVSRSAFKLSLSSFYCICFLWNSLTLLHLSSVYFPKFSAHACQKPGDHANKLLSFLSLISMSASRCFPGSGINGHRCCFAMHRHFQYLI